MDDEPRTSNEELPQGAISSAVETAIAPLTATIEGLQQSIGRMSTTIGSLPRDVASTVTAPLQPIVNAANQAQGVAFETVQPVLNAATDGSLLSDTVATITDAVQYVDQLRRATAPATESPVPSLNELVDGLIAAYTSVCESVGIAVPMAGLVDTLRGQLDALGPGLTEQLGRTVHYYAPDLWNLPDTIEHEIVGTIRELLAARFPTGPRTEALHAGPFGESPSARAIGWVMVLQITSSVIDAIGSMFPSDVKVNAGAALGPYFAIGVTAVAPVAVVLALPKVIVEAVLTVLTTIIDYTPGTES